MPLHLLGKKSWNVYNQDNIDKVRRDEAAAQLRERERQRRADEADADARLQTLRGIQHTSRQAEELGEPEGLDGVRAAHDLRPVKKRKLAGKDDTDREIKAAQQLQILPDAAPKPIARSREATSLVDKGGHFSLFPDKNVHRSKGNEEVMVDNLKRQQDFEDQYTMKFANAAGRKQGSAKPWYTGQVEGAVPEGDVISKTGWGNKDPCRKEREEKRLTVIDPLAAMKKGVKQLREADKHREEWRAQRERDLNEVEELARKHQHRRKRRRSDESSLDGFNLDNGYERDRSEGRRRKSEPGRRHRSHRPHRRLS